MKLFLFCFLLVVAGACGVKIAPSPYLRDEPNRFEGESKKRVQAEAARGTPKPKAGVPTPTPTPFPTESPEPETLSIPPQ